MSKGLLVCVMGVDGSGKSTAAHTAIALLRDRGVDTQYLWNRWEPKLLAPFTDGAGPQGGDVESSDDPPSDSYARKRRLLSSGWRRWAWLWFASMDYALTGSGKARQAVSRNDIVVCDRYTPDFVVDQAMNIDGKAPSLEVVRSLPLLRRFPLPTGYVLLDVDADVALARKDDGLTVQAAAEKVDLYRAFAGSMDATVIDGSASADTVAQELADTVLALTQRRQP